MKEKKQTKAEKNKMERKNRDDFVEGAYELVLAKTCEITQNEHKKMTVTLEHAGRNRHIKFISLGRNMEIRVHAKGDVDLIIQDPIHPDYREVIFTFTPDLKKQKKYYEKMDQILEWLIPLYLDKKFENFLKFMDYAIRDRNIVTAYDHYVKERDLFEGLDDEDDLDDLDLTDDYLEDI